MHASTFGGNSLAMAAGLATGATIERENLLQHVTDNADHVRQRLTSLQAQLPVIREVRVCGMMIGIDLTIPSGPAVGLCMDNGVLINATQDTVVRLLPALNISREDLDRGLDSVAEVLRHMAAQDQE
jgi:acetylornithine/succinyldiaminopimelate/putrescine aminotransferase